MLVQPGEWLFRDCRVHRPASPSSSAPPVPVRVVQWNIERGYELPRIIAALRALDADVVALQEVDVGCERSGLQDTGLLIAQALQLNYAYVCEFHELHSQLRPPRVQGGAQGHHGHAVLSKMDLTCPTTLHHPHQPVDWEKEGESRREPRRGRRVTMRLVVECGGGVQLLVYNGHFEVFAGLLDRVRVLADIINDARQQSTRYPNQVILADCNTYAQRTPHTRTARAAPHSPDVSALLTTAAVLRSVALCVCGCGVRMAHGIARLSGLYCRDAMRWRSLGWTESEWWQHFILDVGESDGPINRRLLPYFPPPSPIPAILRNLDPPFVDPFDAYDDVTLSSHGGWFQAKLDWALVRGDVAVTQHSMGNTDYAASDHKHLTLDLRVGGGAGHKQQGRGPEGRAGQRRRRRPGVCTCSTDDCLYAVQWLIVLSVCVAVLARFFAA